ncbi:MAG TPA: cob(I)yrinic acid a,c-diamide adenosyltransferase [Tissierellales bacterium]|nr:cob(I)yrinic acid a,c-diamide adenosyltransferase [Tissierellales bacterium]
MNIYTKTGDKGETSLFDNKRVSKDSIRVESYGTVDELVSVLGLAKNFINDEKMYELITEIQNKLFIVGATLATEDQSKVPHKINEEDITYLEKGIDEYMEKIKKPTGFIVPGSGKASGFLHVARTVCRRAERRIISLSNIAEVNPLVVKYVNRLSDLIYAMSRVLEEKEEKVKYKE